MNYQEHMTGDNAHAVALAMFGLWYGVRIITCLSLLLFAGQDGIVWAVIAWFVLGMARPKL